MSYLFYISYAREDNTDGLVSKFYEDLRKDIAGKIAARPDEVGFFDAGEKEPWATEFPNRASAVRQSNVFIAIYSPYYFQRKFCGMEWTVFSSRVEAYAKSLPGGFALPALMIPVLWQSEREVSPHIPTALTGLQYKYHALGKTYAEQGLRVMLRNKRFRKEYKVFIPVLADLVIEAARRHKLPALPNLPAFNEIMPAFPVDETPPSPVIEKVESGLSDTQTYDLSTTTQFVPLHDAYERIINFARRFGEPHVALAMHAALPIGLTPELVHLIRVNFVKRAPMIAEADLLLSPLCREVGGGLYEMYPEARELLLAELNEDEEISDSRIEELAEFLMVYAKRNLRSARFPELRNFLVAQQWTALARLRPAETAQSLASALGKRLSAQNPAGSLRLAQLARSMSAQLAGQDNVLVYAAGVESLAFGDVKRASETFGVLGSMNQSPTVKSITLPAPADIGKLWPEPGDLDLGVHSQRSPLPLGVTPRLTLRGELATNNIAWSPDGNTLASTSGDSKVHLWDLGTGEERQAFDLLDNVYSLSWSPDGELVTVGLWTGSIEAWRVSDGETQRLLRGNIRTVLGLAWSQDSRWLASASEDRTILLLDTSDWKERERFTSQNFMPRSLAWAPFGPALVSGDSKGQVHLWEVGEKTAHRIYKGHTARVRAMAWRPDSLNFASGSEDCTVAIWDVQKSDNPIHVLKGHGSGVSGVCFSSDGQILASKSDDGAIRLWRCADWQCVAVIDATAANAEQRVLAFHPSEPFLATCLGSGETISILELDLPTLLKKADQITI